MGVGGGDLFGERAEAVGGGVSFVGRPSAVAQTRVCPVREEAASGLGGRCGGGVGGFGDADGVDGPGMDGETVACELHAGPAMTYFQSSISWQLIRDGPDVLGSKIFHSQRRPVSSKTRGQKTPHREEGALPKISKELIHEFVTGPPDRPQR